MKNIVISGGSDGFGKELARQLSADGNKVIILAPNEQKVRTVAEETGCDYRVCDVSDWRAVESSVSDILEKYDTIDVLVNNASVSNGGKIEEAEAQEIQQSFNVNVVGVLFLIKAVVPAMKQAGRGFIININSQGGLYTKPERALYSGSKWALTGITKVLRAELAPDGIKVAGIYPGALERTMAVDGERSARPGGLPYQDMVDAVRFILSRKSSTVIPELGLDVVGD